MILFLVLSMVLSRHGIIFRSHMMHGRPRRRLEVLICFGMDVLARLATDMNGGDSLLL